MQRQLAKILKLSNKRHTTVYGSLQNVLYNQPTNLVSGNGLSLKIYTTSSCTLRRFKMLMREYTPAREWWVTASNRRAWGCPSTVSGVLNVVRKRVTLMWSFPAITLFSNMNLLTNLTEFHVFLAVFWSMQPVSILMCSHRIPRKESPKRDLFVESVIEFDWFPVPLFATEHQSNQ